MTVCKNRQYIPNIPTTRFNALIPIDKDLYDYCRRWSSHPNPEVHVRVTGKEREILEGCK